MEIQRTRSRASGAAERSSECLTAMTSNPSLANWSTTAEPRAPAAPVMITLRTASDSGFIGLGLSLLLRRRHFGARARARNDGNDWLAGDQARDDGVIAELPGGIAAPA